MLSYEEANRRLDTLRDLDWLSQAEARADALPDGLRQAARTFLTPIPAFWLGDDYEEFRARLDAAGRQLDDAPSEQRAAVMAVIHPRLGPVLDQWWFDGWKRPYQRGWGRKGFRAPTYPGMSAWSRGIELTVLASIVGPFEADPAWLAAWAGHLPGAVTHNWTSEPAAVGGLLASAIDLGGSTGDETLATLIEVSNGEHPVGIMGHHVIVALLQSSRPQAWEVVERLLLSAQLHEGLRQAILEAADQGHPEAFDRMLRLVLDHKLLRFPAAVRAAGIWLGFGAHVTDIPLVENRVRKLAECRASDEARAEAFRSGDPWNFWIALCAGSQRDVDAAMQEMRLLVTAAPPDVRAAILRFAEEAGLGFSPNLAAAWLDDPDLRVASLALSIINRWKITDPGVFDAIGRLVPRLPATPREETGLGVEREPVLLSRAAAAGSLAGALCGRPVADLAPWLKFMDLRGRAELASVLTGEMPHPPVNLAGASAADRQFLIGLLSDRSKHVREPVVRGLARAGLRPEEAPAVEALLTSGSSGLRRDLLTLLAALPAEDAQASAARLAASRDQHQRDAAPELRALTGAGLEPVPGDTGATVPGGAPGPGAGATETADDILASVARGRTAPANPRRRDAPAGPRLPFDARRARRDIEAIEEITERHWNTPLTVSNGQGSQEMLFGDIWRQDRRYEVLPVNADGTRMLLGDVFRAWWRGRPDAGDDAGDAFAAYLAAELPGPQHDEDPRRGDKWPSDSIRRLAGTLASGSRLPRYLDAARHVTRHLAVEHADGAVIDECLDALEDALASVPADVLALTPLVHRDQLEYPWTFWRNFPYPWRRLLFEVLRERPDLFTPAQLGRWFRLERWLESPVPDAVPERPDQTLLVAAHEAGVATDDDVTAEFIGDDYGHRMFGEFTGHWRAGRSAGHPGIAEVASRLRDRLITVELRRGDLPTATSAVITDVRSVSGVALVAELLGKLGKTALTRGGYGSTDKNDVFSHLVRVSFPAPGESGQDLKATAAQAGVHQSRLVDLALYAPQWAIPVQEALGWPGLADGVLWLHAHTRDNRWRVDAELRDSWTELTAERTPVAAADLLDGAVDVEWFRRAYAALGAERWTVLHKSARHAARGNGHRRAQLYAQAMLGQQDAESLIAKITGKRDQEAVRALGLVPLPAEPAARRAQIRHRYAILREFELGSDKFGQLRRTSEKTAVRVGVENLARTAGYQDPLRFTWAVEAATAGDLADGPVVVDKGDVTLALSVDAEGTPRLSVARDGRALKSVPAVLRQDPDVNALQARKTTLAKQAARVRQSLEAAMVAQDVFTPDDFAELRRHPVVAPMLAQLVWVTDGGQTRMVGDGLADTDVPLRVAHPVDLAAEGSWVSWQERLFADERRQPFKQVFRELYVMTEAERSEGPLSQRYDGHQVRPQQALALFNSRGWVASHESRDAVKAFHRHNFTARVDLSDTLLTPAEVDLPVVEGVGFTRRGEFVLQPLESVPPVVFSEAMRDLDLVVSVAHAGGVDPEATASTTEMRAALIRETARLLKLGNIEFAGDRHVVITGTLGEYSLHLGSGIVHRRPGGAVCIIPVGSQHRGRVFLPFADDDPKTAEIVSKTLLLARDHAIKDPTILEQLRS